MPSYPLPRGKQNYREQNTSRIIPTSLRVRWSPTRVCLEAIEVLGEPVRLRDDTFPTALMAKQIPSAVAARVGVTRGAEYRIPLSCRFEPSR